MPSYLLRVAKFWALFFAPLEEILQASKESLIPCNEQG